VVHSEPERNCAWQSAGSAWCVESNSKTCVVYWSVVQRQECRRVVQSAWSGTDNTERHRARRSGSTRPRATLRDVDLCAAHGAVSSATERHGGTQRVTKYYEATGGIQSAQSGTARCRARRRAQRRRSGMERRRAVQSVMECYGARVAHGTHDAPQSGMDRY
jgi:hypothetical protein